MSTGHVLCVNAGSSSLKCSVFAIGPVGDGGGVADGAVTGADAPEPLHVATALAEEIGRAEPSLHVAVHGTTIVDETAELPDHAVALGCVIDAFVRAGVPLPDAIGHRVVHGGPHVVDHVVLDPTVLAELRAAARFAPLHLPAELAAIDAVTDRFPHARQIVCLDTAFHRTLPEVARRLPVPAWVDAAGVHRYGFHGLSYEHVVHELGAEALGRAVIAHLGSGASLAAVRDGVSVDTTMGFTPAGGIVMGTRTGDLDPGVLVHLGREHGLDLPALDGLVNHESGLLGLSGRSADLRDLATVADEDAAAALAIEAFCASVAKAIGALATVTAGLEALVFTGGVGEHNVDVRARVGARLAHLGVELDAARNAASGAGTDGVVSADGSAVAVRVVGADENRVIARHAARLLG